MEKSRLERPSAGSGTRYRGKDSSIMEVGKRRRQLSGNSQTWWDKCRCFTYIDCCSSLHLLDAHCGFEGANLLRNWRKVMKSKVVNIHFGKKSTKSLCFPSLNIIVYGKQDLEIHLTNSYVPNGAYLEGFSSQRHGALQVLGLFFAHLVSGLTLRLEESPGSQRIKGSWFTWVRQLWEIEKKL